MQNLNKRMLNTEGVGCVKFKQQKHQMRLQPKVKMWFWKLHKSTQSSKEH